MSINNLFNIGTSGLFASQAAIEVTSNNIANVNTEGYSRRYVSQVESYAINANPGQMGTGVDPQEVLRYFDKFIEASYLGNSTMRDCYEALEQNLSAIDSLFNEANSDGITSALSKFFADWQDVASFPDDYAVREALIADTGTLTNLLQQTTDQMRRLQEQVDHFIKQDVDRANEIIESIAEINKRIETVTIEGQNTPNTLLDQRDTLVRELSGIIDVQVVNNGDSDYAILTGSGQTLVSGYDTYELRFEGPRSIPALTNASTFAGEFYFEGTDESEYTFEVVTAGAVNAAEFRVSADGGKTWLKDANGNELRIQANDWSNVVEFNGMKLWIGQPGNPAVGPVGADADLSLGDKFTVVPKSGVYWYQDTSSFENITPMLYSNGETSSDRITGGSLSGQLQFRDGYVGSYLDTLDAFASELTWQVNRLHSQGAGLDMFSSVQGAYSVMDTTVALGNDQSGLAFRDKLQSGGSMIYVYDTNGALLGGQGITLDFDLGTPGQQNFDPATNTLEDVRDAINQAVDDAYTAAGLAVPGTPYCSIVNNQINITSSTSGYTFGFGQDSAGLYAALGLNTFLNGTDAASIEVNSVVANDLGLISAGHINGAGQANSGDNTTALAIGSLQDQDVSIFTYQSGNVTQTLSEFFGTLVSTVGADTASADFNLQYQTALAQDLNERQQTIAGVNLDEEMTDLIKFQHSYTAAAKLITTADQMMDTLLGLKN